MALLAGWLTDTGTATVPFVCSHARLHARHTTHAYEEHARAVALRPLHEMLRRLTSCSSDSACRTSASGDAMLEYVLTLLDIRLAAKSRNNYRLETGLEG